LRIGDQLANDPAAPQRGVALRFELSKPHRTLGSTMVYVTHGQVEAMTMGDRIAVCTAGRLGQAYGPVWTAIPNRRSCAPVIVIGEPTMPNVRLPLSGDVMQNINPWNWFFKSVGGQFGLVNINLGRSADPALEEQILDEVGSYGRQLGRIGDVLGVLLKHLDPAVLSDEDKKKIWAFENQLADIERLKSARAAQTP
jgi:hypothetical protein